MRLRAPRWGLIPCTRPSSVGRAIKSLVDCDGVIVARLGRECETRNYLLHCTPVIDTEVRFCDDDDVAVPADIWIPTDFDVLVFGYLINHRRVVPPNDPVEVATNYVVNGNWLANRQALTKIHDRYGNYYDPAWTMNTATRFFLRMLDCGLKVAFRGTIGYHWRRKDYPPSGKRVKNDHALYDELLARGAPQALVQQRAAWDKGEIHA